ncbi:hypothetical protein [Halomonas rhizosphaerae]|uniref:Uncharacterized protein n=1 Tax=Halomonas rhizosphaerae TaxID=3043296 RepID=A0ABT6V0Y8_9GAMM|nr:hypothetical protein [Halomonas rhizosphaerae]MDI5891861.1 hypothetical protein [Halomonas rhizosphaerae]
MRQLLTMPPGGDPAFAPLADSRMYWPVQRARLQWAVRDAFQSFVGIPLERLLFNAWSHGLPGAAQVERLGLSRRVIERELGSGLVARVNPRQLIRSTHWRGVPKHRRPSATAFIWDGRWDLRRGDLRQGSRYRFISDLDEHRHDLTGSEAFRYYKAQLEAGRPWRSHQKGVLLDSEARILAYLGVYLSFMDDMAARGFDAWRGKDALGVAVTREGRLLKINRGLHRLAMAQRVGLDSVPVTVKAVHRQWWHEVTAGTTGRAALEEVTAALATCTPETEPGALDPLDSPDDFTWPSP